MSPAPSVQSVAEEASHAFTFTHRGDDRIVTLKDDAPDWVRSLVYEAHGDFLPEDWRYECIRAAVDWVAESDPDADADDIADTASEFADGCVDVYTGARLQWLASNLRRPGYVDEAVDEFGASDLDTAERIGLGQYAEASEVFGSVLRSLVDETESREDDEDEEGGDDA